MQQLRMLHLHAPVRACTRLLRKQHCRKCSSKHKDAINAIRDVLGDRLTTSRAILEQHGRDESYHPCTPPDAVAFVQSTQEVSQVLQICSLHRTPVIPFGTGTSLEGHIAADFGGISLDVNAMNQIISIQPENMCCRVQAGVTREQLNIALRATGLFFPVDPGANASIGGMIATNASGTTSILYGNMKTAVMALKAVLPNGRVIRTGSKTRKSSAGYDISRLLIGSEGTLAVVTEAQLLLFGIPQATKTMLCSFPSIRACVEACTMISQCGVRIARMELMDEAAIAAINAYSILSYPMLPALGIECCGTDIEISEQSDTVQEIINDFGATEIQWAISAEERKKLWAARHAAWYATLSQIQGSQGLCTDVCLPYSKLADVIVETQQDVKASKLLGTIVGHVGDGNFHVMIPFDPRNEKMMKQVKKFSDRLILRALEAEGTCTGEHGIGNGKLKYLQLEHGDLISVMSAIKHAFDPQMIMNPGKIFRDVA